MKILHTADLHLGQVIYQNYDRSDEHRHFFRQLERWCVEEGPDALLVSGDVFDIQQPSAAVKRAFTDYFVRLHQVCPQMHIVIIAGNHDSASRIQADSAVWELANVHLVGNGPTPDRPTPDPSPREGRREGRGEGRTGPTPDPSPVREGRGEGGTLAMDNGKWIIRIDSGYIVALPYMTGERREIIQSILDKVADDNTMGLPVVMMAHQAVTGLDPAGHSFDIGTLRTLEASAMGCGYDYLALGHIHKPQTISPTPDPSPVREGRGEGGTLTMDNGQWTMENGQWTMENGQWRMDNGQLTIDNGQLTIDNGQWRMDNGKFRAPVVRYSGSALHVSCDETYPHTVSVVEIDRHGGTVEIRELRIDELRHFYVLPLDGSSFTSAEDALEYMNEFIAKGMRGYIRFRFDAGADLPWNFSQMVYDALAPYNEEWRYNPKIIWSEEEGSEKVKEKSEKLVFEVAELQQMTDPMVFIERTQDQYPGLDLEDVRQAFEEVMLEAQKVESNS